MLLKTQRNQFFQELNKLGLQLVNFQESFNSNSCRIMIIDSGKGLWFEVEQKTPNTTGQNYIISTRPSFGNSLDKLAVEKQDSWDNGL